MGIEHQRPYPTGRAEAMRRATHLLVHTGQRPSDVLRVSWFHDDGEHLTVRQRKTGKLDEIYRGELGQRLDAWKEALPVAPANADAPFARIVHSPIGAPYAMTWRNNAFRRVATAGSVEVQARDLRCAAVTRLYEAGCSAGRISASTGHDSEICRRSSSTISSGSARPRKRRSPGLDEHRAQLPKLGEQD
jgi:integrase